MAPASAPRSSWLRSDCQLLVGSTPYTLLLRLQAAYDLRRATSTELYCKLYVGDTPVDPSASSSRLRSFFSIKPHPQRISQADHRAYHSQIYSSTHPSCAKWMEDFEIPLLNPNEVLSIRVKCDHALSSPTVGTCAIELGDLPLRRQVDRILKLRKDHKRAGNLRVQLSVVPTTHCVNIAQRQSAGPRRISEGLGSMQYRQSEPKSLPIHVSTRRPSGNDELFWRAERRNVDAEGVNEMPLSSPLPVVTKEEEEEEDEKPMAKEPLQTEKSELEDEAKQLAERLEQVRGQLYSLQVQHAVSDPQLRVGPRPPTRAGSAPGGTLGSARQGQQRQEEPSGCP